MKTKSKPILWSDNAKDLYKFMTTSADGSQVMVNYLGRQVIVTALENEDTERLKGRIAGCLANTPVGATYQTLQDSMGKGE